MPVINAGTRIQSPSQIPVEPASGSYNQMQMQLSSDAHIPDGLIAAMTLLSEKPRQGVPSRNLAPNLGIDELNSTVAIGLRAGLALESVRSRYTGKERDSESGNDYFGARYYASSMGRFMSPDPSQLYYADPGNPQSLNLYSYVLNNPLRNTDPSGEECVWDDGSYDAADDADTGSADKCSGQGGTWVDPNLFENAMLTNGQNANIQYGQSSSQANSTIVSSWLGPSSTTNAPDNSQVTLNIPMNVWLWAMQQTTPNHGPWTYGNWAGPGGQGAPIDDLDAGAMMHDYCYAANGMLSSGSNFGVQNNALQACNQALCDTAKKAQDKLTAEANQPGRQWADSSYGDSPVWAKEQADINEWGAAKQIIDYFTLVPFHGNGCQH